MTMPSLSWTDATNIFYLANERTTRMYKIKVKFGFYDQNLCVSGIFIFLVRFFIVFLVWRKVWFKIHLSHSFASLLVYDGFQVVNVECNSNRAIFLSWIGLLVESSIEIFCWVNVFPKLQAVEIMQFYLWNAKMTGKSLFYAL